MLNPFSRKGGLKRHKTLEKSDAGRRGRKNRRTEDKVVSSPPPSASENSFEEQSDDLVSEGEEVVYKEPSVYDNLLKSLRSGNDTIAEEGGKSDTEEDVDDESESLSMTEEEDDSEEGIDTESPKSHAMVSKLKSASMAGVVEQSEDTEDEDDEASNMDKEQLGVNGQSLAVSTSSFSFHMGRKLSNSDVDILSNKKWKYKWEMPAVGMSNCKWIGTGECLKDGDDNMSTGYGLKLKLYEHWLDIYKSSGGHDFDSSIQRNFFTLFNSYRDVLHHNKKPFYLKGLEEDSSIRDAYIMHSLNHVFRTRDLLMKNNTKLAKQQEGAKEEILVGENFLDHGFTRPKILILLPLASIALRVVRRLIQLTPSAYKVNVDHMDRFSDDFGTGVVEDEEVENEFSRKSSKPSDFQALFGGNNNDHFMVGIKFTKKSVKLYSDFYSSDIIVASPLGLITKIAEAEAEKEKDVDYLSSIEVLIIDHAEVIAMQNWSHVNSVVEKMNCIPSKQHGTDVMRIRHWYLDGHAKFYRQTIILGSYLNPDMNSLYNHHCVNFQGKVKLVCEHKGVLSKVVLQVRQLYERFDAESIGDVDDARFDYFTKKVFPKIKDSVQGGILLFISSYFEFVRIRNFLKSQNASFCLLGEYTKQSDISRSRIWLFEGKRKMMLYTERAHFYHRYKIRGIQNIIIYSLPEKKEFYPEIVNMLEGSHNMNCTVLFSRFDQLRLERIVGTASAKRMTTSEKGVFVFC